MGGGVRAAWAGAGGWLILQVGPGVLGVHAGRGGFHIKAAGLVGPRSYFAAKTNANFPDNPQRFGLPTIRGTVVLCDATNGEPLAMMDSSSVTAPSLSLA